MSDAGDALAIGRARPDPESTASPSAMLPFSDAEAVYGSLGHFNDLYLGLRRPVPALQSSPRQPTWRDVTRKI
jgi:hypothetical protein